MPRPSPPPWAPKRNVAVLSHVEYVRTLTAATALHREGLQKCYITLYGEGGRKQIDIFLLNNMWTASKRLLCISETDHKTTDISR